MIRMIGDFEVIQRTKDGYFDANALLNAWNKKPGCKKKRMDDFLSSAETKALIETIIKEEHVIDEKSQVPDSQVGDLAALPHNQIVIKSKVKTFKNGSRRPASIWVHPFIFIDFAMWLNPTFKYQVLKFVHDKMIEYRKKAGDEYNVLGAAVQKIVAKDFMKVAMPKVAKALNWIVFNCHEPGIRNRVGDEEKQRELSALERKIVDLIDEEFITDYAQLVNYLRKMYIKKNCPKVFAA
jgi:hypothetical protein